MIEIIFFAILHANVANMQSIGYREEIVVIKSIWIRVIFVQNVMTSSPCGVQIVLACGNFKLFPVNPTIFINKIKRNRTVELDGKTCFLIY